MFVSSLFKSLMTNEIEMKALRGIYVAHKFSITPIYKSILQQYSIQPFEVDFKNLGTVRRINEQISSATRGLIKNTVQQRDLSDATMFLLSTIYFKGKWKVEYRLVLCNRSFNTSSAIAVSL